MEVEKLSKNQFQVAATGFLSLFSLVGIMFYGLPFFYDFWVTDFGWTRAQVTSGNALGKIIVGPLFGFLAGWIIDRFGPQTSHAVWNCYGWRCINWIELDELFVAVLLVLFV